MFQSLKSLYECKIQNGTVMNSPVEEVIVIHDAQHIKKDDEGMNECVSLELALSLSKILYVN